MSEERVLSALQALSESDRELEASHEVEMRLRQAFRWRRLVRKLSWASVAAGLAIAVWVGGKTSKNPGQQAELPVPHEVVTEFYPLMDVAPPFESGAILRVNLSAGVMRTVGLPVDEDRLMDPIQADVLVGQEGLARAIRFVKIVQ